MAISALNNNIEYEENSRHFSVGKNRLTYIDIAKGIGISMIVWGHAHCLWGNYFIACAVPLFFLISGFLYNKEQKPKEYIKRKVLTLYLPFLLCNLIWPTFILFHRAHLGDPIINNIKDIFLIILTLKKDGFLFGATWFLSSLFLICVSYKLIDNSIKNWRYKYNFITGFYLFFAFAACQLLPFLDASLRKTIILSLFFAIGFFIKSNISYIRRINTKYTMIVACLIFILIEIYLTKTGMVGYFYEPNSLYQLTTFAVSALFSVYIIIYLSKIAGNHMNKKICKLFSYLGQNSLHILLWQFVFFEILTGLFLKVNNIPIYLIDRFPHAIKTEGIWWLVYFLIGIFGPIFMVNAFKACKRKIFTNKASEPLPDTLV